MKKFLVVVGALIFLGIVVLSLFLYYNEMGILCRKFNITLPQSVHLLEFQRSFDMTNGSVIAAKIATSKEDYETICSSLLEKYWKFDPTDYPHEDVEDMAPQGSDRFVNLEKYNEDFPWWDLETDDIVLLFHYESANKRPGARCPCVRRIYVSEMDSDVTLYLFYQQ